MTFFITEQTEALVVIVMVEEPQGRVFLWHGFYDQRQDVTYYETFRQLTHA